MKKITLALFLIIFAIIFSACKNKMGVEEFPANFKVDIPTSISSSTTQKTISVDQANGDEIYQHLRLFIAVGEFSADLVQNLILAIREYNLNVAQEFSFTGDDDGRTKNVIVEENVEFEGKMWMYCLTLTDALNESDSIGGKGLQIFWNNDPIDGIAILYPRNVNYSDTADSWAYSMVRVEYSEVGDNGYEKQMIVTITDIPVDTAQVYDMSALKMFVGKNGDIIDLYGNSAHPNANFFTPNKGFDWAFVASANEAINKSVAQVGLPTIDLNTTDRITLLETNSLYNVFETNIQQWYYDENGSDIDSLTLASYLTNAQSPGFFNQDGFIAAGEAPTADYDALVSHISALAPFNPYDIMTMHVKFKE